MSATPQRGDFVRVRTRRWLVEDERGVGEGLTALRLACVDDDAQGETVELLWDAELDGSILSDEGWAAVAKNGTDDPTVFSAYLRTLRWVAITRENATGGDVAKFRNGEGRLRRVQTRAIPQQCSEISREYFFFWNRIAV